MMDLVLEAWVAADRAGALGLDARRGAEAGSRENR